MTDEDPLIRINWKKIWKYIKYTALFLKFIVWEVLILTFIGMAVGLIVGIRDSIRFLYKYSKEKHHNHGVWIVGSTILLLIFFFLVVIKIGQIQELKASHQTQQEEKDEIIFDKAKQIHDLQKELEEKKQELHEKDEKIKKLSIKRSTARVAYSNGVLEGKISHYSRNGCLGCSATLTMSNGEPLDDNRLTIAVPPNTIPMNTQVRVTNLINGKSTVALVTDTGGFSSLGRVADLTPAVARAINTTTDRSQVRIEVIN